MTTMLPFDLRFPFSSPRDRPREFWFDHAIVRETCSTKVARRITGFSEDCGSESQTLQGANFGCRTSRRGAKTQVPTNFLFPVISALGFRT